MSANRSDNGATRADHRLLMLAERWRILTVLTLMRPMMISLPSRTIVWNLTIAVSTGTVYVRGRS